MKQEEKAKAYDKVRKKIAIRFGSNVANEFFAEFEESEDEKVRKEIVNYFQCQSEEEPTRKDIHNKWIAWLEKQGQVKESAISQHENRTCEESGNSLTCEDERIRAEENKGNIGGISANWSEEDEMVRKDLIGFFKDEAFLCHKKKQIIAWLKKQGDSPIKWNKNTKDCKPQKNHSVLMKTIHGIAEGEWQGEKWFQYRWSSSIKDSDVLFWIELSDIEKQGETFPVLSNSSNSGKNEQKPADIFIGKACDAFCKVRCKGKPPRSTCTSLGTCREYDDFCKTIMEKQV